MILDLRRFFEGDTAWESMPLSIDFSDVLEQGERIFPENGEADLKLRGYAGAVSLLANVRYALQKPCDRCGEPTRREYERSFSHTLVRGLNGEEADDDEYLLCPDGKADLEELLREDVLLGLPTKFLCKEDCKGLCPRCGKNLNLGPCGCDLSEADHRMDELKSLLD